MDGVSNSNKHTTTTIYHARVGLSTSSFDPPKFWERRLKAGVRARASSKAANICSQDIPARKLIGLFAESGGTADCFKKMTHSDFDS